MTSPAPHTAWNGKLDVSFLKTLTCCDEISKIEELQLCDLGLTDDDLKPDIFNQLTSLVEIDLSRNKLTSIPKGIFLGNLKYLDMSNNYIEDVEWLGRFPSLIDVDIAGNIGLTVDDSYKIMFLLENLQFLDGKHVEERDKIGRRFTEELLRRIEKLWDGQFKGRFLKTNNKEDTKRIKEEFLNFAQQNVRFGPNSLKGYRIWRIQDIVKDVFELKTSDKNKNVMHNHEVLEKISDELNQQVAKTVKSQKYKHFPPKHEAGKRLQMLEQLSPGKLCCDFEPLSFLQCHSGENEADDFSTQVWSCTFEPDLNDFSRTTNKVATCGGDTVCVIDCETALVEARFQHCREEFYAAAWTTLSLNSHAANILVAGGCLGLLHLIHVSQGVCYGRIKLHSSPIQTVKFLPSSPTRILTADKRGIIYLIDIDVPTLPKYTYSWKKLLYFTGLNFTPLKLLVVGDYLLCGSESGLFCWNEKNLSNSVINSRARDVPVLCEIKFPCVQDEPLVDAIVMLNNDVIVTKCAQEGVIFLWRFSNFLNKIFQPKKQKLKKVTVNLLAELKWSTTQHCYINVAVNQQSGAVLVGDDAGCIWVYNVSSAIRSTRSKTATKVVHDMIFPCSIIPFPQCSRPDGSSISKLKEKMIYNDVTCSSDENCIVAVSDKNIVAIFHKIIS